MGQSEAEARDKERPVGKTEANRELTANECLDRRRNGERQTQNEKKSILPRRQIMTQLKHRSGPPPAAPGHSEVKQVTFISAAMRDGFLNGPIPPLPATTE